MFWYEDLYHSALNFKIFIIISSLSLSFRKTSFSACEIFLAIFSLTNAFPPFSLISSSWTPTCIFPVFSFRFNVKHIYESPILSRLSDVNSPVCFPSCTAFPPVSHVSPQPWKWVVLTSTFLFYRQGNWGLERWNDVPKAHGQLEIELVS